jgi:hypothetical protein
MSENCECLRAAGGAGGAGRSGALAEGTGRMAVSVHASASQQGCPTCFWTGKREKMPFCSRALTVTSDRPQFTSCKGNKGRGGVIFAAARSSPLPCVSLLAGLARDILAAGSLRAAPSTYLPRSY